MLTAYRLPLTTQGGFGCSRSTAANAIAGVLRRGPAATARHTKYGSATRALQHCTLSLTVFPLTAYYCPLTYQADSYCVVSRDTTEGTGRDVWTGAQWDAAFGRVDSDAATGDAAASELAAGEAAVAALTFDLSDERLAAFTRPQPAEAANPLIAPLAASGPYYSRRPSSCMAST